MKKEKTGSLPWILVIALSGFLLSIMVTMMYMGREINFENFLSSGRVYDFSKKDMSKSSAGWIYDKKSGRYYLQKDNAWKKFRLDGTESTWGYLYIDISELSVTELQAIIRCYDKKMQCLEEWQIVLHQGENIVILPENVPMYKIAIGIKGQRGQFFTVDSMQIREKASGYTTKRFFKIWGAAYGGFLVVFVILLRFSNWIGKGEKKVKEILYGIVEIFQYTYQIFSESIGARIEGRFGKSQKRMIRVMLFLLLFLWMVVGNVLGWNKSVEAYRYFVLICLILLLLIGIVSWKRTLKQIEWKNNLVICWFCIWISIMLSDLFVVKTVGMTGVMMLLAGSLVFIWNQMDNKSIILFDMMDALEIFFWMATGYCMLFREKRLTIHYNGIFCDPAEFSMYAVLMLGVFLVKLELDLNEVFTGRVLYGNCMKRKGKRKIFIHITGSGLALYFILRSDYITGYIVAAICCILFLKRQLPLVVRFFKKAHGFLLYILAGGIIAFGVICIVHFSIKYVPDFLDIEIQYKKEKLVTGLNDEMYDAFQALEPGLLDGVKQEEDKQTVVVWKNYIRRWNLLGNREEKLEVFRGLKQAENAYVFLAYKYGIFILIPYISYQICLLLTGVKRCRESIRYYTDTTMDFWILLIQIAFLGFCFYGVIEESTFGHPLWICSYLTAGYWFTDKREKTEF